MSGYRHRDPDAGPSPAPAPAPAPLVQPPAPVLGGPMGAPPSARSTVPTPVLDAAADGYGANTGSDVGPTETSFDTGTLMGTLNELTAGGTPLYVGPDGNGGWTAWSETSVGPVQNTTQVTTGGGRTDATNRTTVDAEAVEFWSQVAIGNEAVNDRWGRTENNLAYTMSEVLGGAADLEVVGMRDKLSLSSGFSTTDQAPISIGHSDEISTGHDVYHFRAADGTIADDDDREQALAAELRNVDDVSALTTGALALMEPGEGFAFVDDSSRGSSNEGSLNRQLGPVTGSLTVGFGSTTSEVTQTAVAKVDDSTVRISLASGEGQGSSSQFGLGVSREVAGDKPGGFDVGLSATTTVDEMDTTEVQFDIDITTPEGLAQFEKFTQTGLLPGADQLTPTNADDPYGADRARYDELSTRLEGLAPDSQAYAETQAELFETSGELNRAFMDRSRFLDVAEDAPEPVRYDKWRTQTEQTVTNEAEFFAWKMSRVSSVERKWDEYQRENGAWDFEAGFYQDKEWAEGDALVVASPNSEDSIALGTSSRANMDTLRYLDENGGLPASAVDPLARAAIDGELDDFDEGGAQITTALTWDQLSVLAENGGDMNELLTFDSYTYDNDRVLQAENIVSELVGEVNKENGAYSQADLDKFFEQYGTSSESFRAQNIVDAMRDTTPKEFADMDPIAREFLIENRAVELATMGRNPWEVLTLVDAVEDPVEKARLLRETFQRIEDVNMDLSYGQLSYSTAGVLGGDGANMASALLVQHMSTVADGLDPADATGLMSGVRIDVVDSRAQEWSSDRILEPLSEGKSEDEVLNGLIEEHVNWSDEHEDWDQMSDNFQAVALAGGSHLVGALGDKLGEDRMRDILATTHAEDPARLLIYEKALAGTPYAHLISEVRNP